MGYADKAVSWLGESAIACGRVHYPGDLAACGTPARRTWSDGSGCAGRMASAAGAEKGSRLPASEWPRTARRKRVRPLADFVLRDTRTPLMVWFEAAWLLAVTQCGIGASSLQPLLGLGSDETAWACHRLHPAMGRTSANLLSGHVEVDETVIAGVKTGGMRDRGAPGKAFVVHK